MSKIIYRLMSVVLVLTLTFGSYYEAMASTTAVAGTYYVSTTGNDANACTQSAPCKTITKGVSTAQSGGTVNVSAGVYHEYVSVNKSITIVSSGATIDGVNASGSVNDGLVSVTASNVKLQGFTISNAKNYGLANFGSNNQFVGNVIHHTQGAGIWMRDGKFNTFDGNELYDTVLQNSASSNGAYYTCSSTNTDWPSAINSWGAASSNIWRNNNVHDNCGEGMVAYTGDLVENNTFKNNWSIEIYIVADKAIVRNNTIVDTKPYAARGSDQSWRSVPAGISIGDESVCLADNNTITGNSITGARYGVSFYAYISCSGIKNSLIENNTITNAWEYGLRILSGAHANSIIRNNKVQLTSGRPLTVQNSGFTMTGNILFSNANVIEWIGKTYDFSGWNKVVAGNFWGAAGAVTPTLLPTLMVTPTATLLPPTATKTAIQPTVTPTSTLLPPTATKTAVQPTVTPTATLLPPSPTAISASNTYYVSPTGNDANACTQSAPCKTITKGVSTAQSGGMVIVSAGVYHEYVYVDKSVTVISNGATVDGVNASGTVRDGLVSAVANNVKIQGFTISNAKNYGLANFGSNNQFVGNVIHHTQGAGIWMRDGKFNTFDGNELYDTVLQNSASSNGAYYICSSTNTDWPSAINSWGAASSNIWRNNNVHDNCGEGMVAYTGDLVENNTFKNNWSVEIYIVADKANVRNNTIIDTKPYAARGSDQSWRSVPAGISIGDESVCLADNNTITGNNITGARYGVSFYAYISCSGIKNSLIENNTITNAWEYGLRILSGAHANSIIRNNTIQLTSGRPLTVQNSGFTMTGNILFSNSNVIEWIGKTYDFSGWDKVVSGNFWGTSGVAAAALQPALTVTTVPTQTAVQPTVTLTATLIPPSSTATQVIIQPTVTQVVVQPTETLMATPLPSLPTATQTEILPTVPPTAVMSTATLPAISQ